MTDITNLKGENGIVLNGKTVESLIKEFVYTNILKDPNFSVTKVARLDSTSDDYTAFFKSNKEGATNDTL